MKSLMSCHRITEVENSTSGGVTFTITGENRTWRVYILSRREVEGGVSDIQSYWSHSIPPKIRVNVFNILYISLNYLHTVKLHLFLIVFFFHRVRGPTVTSVGPSEWGVGNGGGERRVRLVSFVKICSLDFVKLDLNPEWSIFSLTPPPSQNL